MKIILLGAPGAGKGTHGEIISKKLSIPTISTGNIFRAAIREESALGLKVKDIIERGELVPDEIVVDIIRDRLNAADCARGYILDGVPRTIAQAEALEKAGIGIDAVLVLKISDEIIEKRMTGRRTCIKCGTTYHVESNPSKKEGICDTCGGALIIRQDDEPETVRNRLKVYHKQTEPLLDFYRSRGKLLSVDSQPEVAETSKLIYEALGI